MPMCPSIRKAGVLGIASALIFLVYLMQYQVSSLAFLLVPEFGMDSVGLANLMFAPMLLAAVVGIPLGALADRFGVKRVVGLCLAVSLAGAVLRAVSTCYGALFTGSLLLGFAPAALNANLMRLLGAWFSDKSSFAIGVYYACSGLGAAAAMLTAALFDGASGAFGASAALFAAVLLLWWVFVEDSPAGPVRGVGSGTLRYVGRAARISSVWYIALITGFGLAAKTAFLGFLPSFFGEALAPGDANFMAAFVTYGGVAGCILGPLICARRAHPRRFVVGCALAATALMLSAALLPSSPSALLLFAAGMATSVTAPIVEAIPCVLPSLRTCVGSAGGIIGTVSLAMTYAVPLAITALAGSDYLLVVCLAGGCFVLTVPFLLLLPGITAQDFCEEGECAR